jgi:hypothetical protein
MNPINFIIKLEEDKFYNVELREEEFDLFNISNLSSNNDLVITSPRMKSRDIIIKELSIKNDKLHNEIIKEILYSNIIDLQMNIILELENECFATIVDYDNWANVILKCKITKITTKIDKDTFPLINLAITSITSFFAGMLTLNYVHKAYNLFIKHKVFC